MKQEQGVGGRGQEIDRGEDWGNQVRKRKNILISVGNQRFRLFLQEEDIPLAEEKEGEEELK